MLAVMADELGRTMKGGDVAGVVSASAFAVPELLCANDGAERLVDENDAARGERHPLSDDGSAPMRVLLIASAGGHWTELHRLRHAFVGTDCQFVSTAPGLAPPIGDRAVLSVADTARDTIQTLVPAARSLWRIFRAFEPDLVVSTGAAPGALALAIGRLFGARTIWIDSIANSEGLSLSGRLVRPFADMRITQWRHLADRQSSLRYLGQIL